MIFFDCFPIFRETAWEIPSESKEEVVEEDNLEFSQINAEPALDKNEARGED